MFKKSFVLILSTLFVATSFAATDAEVATWADQVLSARAKTVAVKDGEAKIVSVFMTMANRGGRKVKGKVYWDVDCYQYRNGESVKKTCVNTLETVVNMIGEEGFGRYTMKSCYVGQAEKVCEIIQKEASQTNDVESHGMFENVKCSIAEKTVNVEYTTVNDYEKNKTDGLSIAPCL